MKQINTLREQLASQQHDIWVSWMSYMFEQGTIIRHVNLSDDGRPDELTWAISADKLERWTRQMHTPYAELPEAEKKSDRHQADKILVVIHGEPER